MDDFPRETPSTWNPKLGSGFCECFLHTIMKNSLMCLFHNESGEVVTSWDQNGKLGRKRNLRVSQSASATPHTALIFEEVELLGQILEVSN